MSKMPHSWKVMAAILVEADCLHVDEITERVKSSGLTTLGLKSDTANKTAGTILRTQVDKETGKPVFQSQGHNNGIYELFDRQRTRDNPEIQALLEKLRQKKVV